MQSIDQGLSQITTGTNINFLLFMLHSVKNTEKKTLDKLLTSKKNPNNQKNHHNQTNQNQTK